MNISRCFKSFGVIVTTIALATFLYAQQSDIQEIASESALDSVIQNNSKVVVFFYDPMCPVCNAFKKKGIYPETAHSLPDITFVMVSSKIRRPEEATNKFLFQKYDVTAFPSFVFFNDGNKINQFAGYSDNPHFTQKVSSLFTGK